MTPDLNLDEMILARPGYNKKYKKDVSWEELKKSFLLYKRIPMIVAGGSHAGEIDPNEAIGHVDAKIYDDEQIIKGQPVFYKERFDSIPNEIQSRLLHKKHVPASLGYRPYENMRKLDHVAIGVESPVFPDIGFHAEEEDTFYYEETEGINKEPADEEESTPDYVTAETLTSTLQDFKQDILAALQPKEEEPESPDEDTAEVEEQEETETEEQPEEEPKDQQKPPKVEPARKPTPKELPNEEGWVTTPEGRRVLSWQVAGQAKKKEE